MIRPNSKIIKIAMSEALKSIHRYKIGAVIYKGKSLISKGHNYTSKGVRSITSEFVKWPWAIHAEVDSIIKAKTDLKGSTMLVVRVNQKGTLAMALPCTNCIGYINYVGIKRVYYSNREGIVELYE